MSERHVSFDMIVQSVSAVTGISPRAMMADRRNDDFVRARYAVFWVAAEATSLSLAAIARLAGDRDHTTVLYGLRRAEELRVSDATFRLTTDTLLGTLRAVEANDLIHLSRDADPIEAARRVMADPKREAVRVSVQEITAMSNLIVQAFGDGEEPPPPPFEPTAETPIQETEHAA